MLLAEIKQFTPCHELHVIGIPFINDAIRQQLDNFLVSICEGESGSDLSLVKLRLLQFLERKDLNTQMGAIAELFIHLYLRGSGFKQEFLFFNLEEGSIKKGFDGIFSRESNTYLVESKSGSILSKSISHREKLQEAYSDLSKYVSGKSNKGNNNPWKNAYNHASHIDVGTNITIRKKIKQLQDNFDHGRFSSISDFNIIPCSTIFLNDVLDFSKNKEILNDNKFILKFLGNTNNAICITKSSLTVFVSYLRS